ncbi:MAG: hypothetical protein KGQ69_02960, partial [Rhodospirillales bacterium]|nr:hypothetical protein [Rhodospirillales bacterium]
MENMPDHELRGSAENVVDQVVGYLDRLSETLNVHGWAWRPEEPARRLEIEFVINGEPAGTILADMYRQDVEAAGHGDGQYGFAWALPLDAL